MEVVAALRRLGYTDAPSVGDHISCMKVVEHNVGRVTIKTGVDSRYCGKKDVARIKRQTHLKGDMWSKALAKKLKLKEYDKYLLSLPIEELVPRYWLGVVRDNTRRADPPSDA